MNNPTEVIEMDESTRTEIAEHTLLTLNENFNILRELLNSDDLQVTDLLRCIEIRGAVHVLEEEYKKHMTILGQEIANIELADIDLKLANEWNDLVNLQNAQGIRTVENIDADLATTEKISKFDIRDSDALDILHHTKNTLLKVKYFGSDASQIGGRFGDYLTECRQTYAWHDFFITQCNYFFNLFMKPMDTELGKRTALVQQLQTQFTQESSLNLNVFASLSSLTPLKQHQSVLNDFQTSIPITPVAEDTATHSLSQM